LLVRLAGGTKPVPPLVAHAGVRQIPQRPPPLPPQKPVTPRIKPTPPKKSIVKETDVTREKTKDGFVNIDFDNVDINDEFKVSSIASQDRSNPRVAALKDDYYLVVWWRFGRDPEAGTIIPLFAAPDGLSPAVGPEKGRFIRTSG